MAIPVGSKAEKEAFFGRTRELRDLWALMDANHVVLSGPRRLGKTSLLQRLADQAEDHGWVARLADVQGADSITALFDELLRAVPDASLLSKAVNRLKGSAGQAADRLKKIELKLPGGFGGALDLQAPPAQAWAEQARELQRRVSAQPVLIMVDEFSVFLDKLLQRDAQNAEQLLGWLRAWRMTTGLQCRFIFSGSVGLNALLARHRLSTYFNDCFDFGLQPFALSEALHMLQTQLRREGVAGAPEVPQKICDNVGWLSPYYLNLLLVEAMRAAQDRADDTGQPVGPVTLPDVDSGRDRLLAMRSRFVHWVQRLERDLQPADYAMASRLLAAVAGKPEGLSRTQLMARLQRLEPDVQLRRQRLDRVLWNLEEDGYVSASGERVQFLSFLLRDYWARNHGL